MRCPNMVLVLINRSLMLVAVIQVWRIWLEKRSFAEGRYLVRGTKISPFSMGRTLENMVEQITCKMMGTIYGRVVLIAVRPA